MAATSTGNSAQITQRDTVWLACLRTQIRAPVVTTRFAQFVETPLKNMSAYAQPSRAVVKLKFVPELQQIFVCERGSLAVKIYNQQMQMMALLFVRMPAREGVCPIFSCLYTPDSSSHFLQAMGSGAAFGSTTGRSPANRHSPGAGFRSSDCQPGSPRRTPP